MSSRLRAGVFLAIALTLIAGAAWKGTAALESGADRLSKTSLTPSIASGLYWAACMLKRPEACTTLAKRYDEGVGVSQDRDRALALHTEACIQGSLSGCASLVKKREAGVQVGDALSNALAEYRKRCETNDAHWCGKLGMLYMSSSDGSSVDLARASQAFERSCELGEFQSCGMLAFLAANGVGMEKDLAKAARLYQRACNGADLDTCVKLGELYARGEGVSPDRARAIELFTRACDGGKGEGCLKEAAVYITADDTHADIVKGRALMERACDLNSADGCRFIAQMYLEGLAGTKDIPRGLVLAEKACTLGQGEICAALGQAYGRGEPKLDIKVDKTRALGFYKAACSHGQSPSCEEAKAIEPGTPGLPNVAEAGTPTHAATKEPETARTVAILDGERVRVIGQVTFKNVDGRLEPSYWLSGWIVIFRASSYVPGLPGAMGEKGSIYRIGEDTHFQKIGDADLALSDEVLASQFGVAVK